MITEGKRSLKGFPKIHEEDDSHLRLGENCILAKARKPGGIFEFWK